MLACLGLTKVPSSLISGPDRDSAAAALAATAAAAAAAAAAA